MHGREIVPAARYDVQPRIGQPFEQTPAGRDRADRIVVAPQQQRRLRDTADVLRQVRTQRHEPVRQPRVRLGETGAPVLRAESGHVEAAGRDRQHEMRDEIRLVERRAHRDYAAHRLRDHGGRPVDACEHMTHETVEIVDGGIARRVAEARIRDDPPLGRMREPAGQRLPERGAARCAGQEEQLRWSGHGVLVFR
ncbi:hypothetical protein WL84_00175 [Burkholderia cenocepacia]|nr:hypothetical protein WL84_00175 [Burkholderia cenocepacia]